MKKRISKSEGVQKFKYPIEVFWSSDDDGYIAIVPDMEGCNAFGETEEEAIHEVQIAAEAWLELAKDMGREIPKPSIDNNFSGEFLMQVPKRLHAELSRTAKIQGVSLNQYVLFLLTEKQAKQKKAHNNTLIH